MILISAKLGRLDVDDAPFASGGAGAIHWGRLAGGTGRSYCVKLMTSPKPGDFDKITWMCANAPTSAANAGWGMLCWPLDMVSRPGGTVPVGYVMPVATPGSVELSNLTQLRWPGKNPPPLDSKLHRTTADGMARRMLVACNLAAAVNLIHRLGFVFVDLKPQNVLISGAGGISLVDLDSLQVQVAGRLYRGPLGSGEYMPFESYKMNPANSGPIDKSWDLFALAVIVYELLFGIHPYTATVSDSFIGIQTIEDSIRYKMYVHGSNRGNLASIPPPHQEINKVPQEIAQLFRRAFDAATPAERPSAQEWGEALFKGAQAGLPALSSSVYVVPRPRTVRPASPVPAAASMSPAAGMQPCWGPLNDTLVCPHRNSAYQRFGVPNRTNGIGNAVFVCPDCLANSKVSPVSSPSPPLQPCWGPLNSSASCVLTNTPNQRFGLPNRSNGGGHGVYVCPDCLAPSSVGAAPSMVTPRAASPSTEESCWGPLNSNSHCPHSGRRGVPNVTNNLGKAVYLCPDCAARKLPKLSSKSFSEKYDDALGCGCWGLLLGGGLIYYFFFKKK
jgi:serine/threonine protein kinase